MVRQTESDDARTEAAREFTAAVNAIDHATATAEESAFSGYTVTVELESLRADRDKDGKQNPGLYEVPAFDAVEALFDDTDGRVGDRHRHVKTVGDAANVRQTSVQF